MYICEKCKRVVGPRVPEHRLPEYKEVKGQMQIKKEHRLCPFCAVKYIQMDEEEKDFLNVSVQKTYFRDNKAVMLRSMLDK